MRKSISDKKQKPPVASAYHLADDDLRRIDTFRREKFSSVLTVMFTDIEGYTVLTERHGDARVLDLLAEHNEILIDLIEQNKAGRYVKNIGDSILAVFVEPSLAVDRALKIQRALAERNAQAPKDEALRVRIGLHMGQVAHGDVMASDVFGSQVNRASRIQSVARGNQVLMSEVTYENARHWLQGPGYEGLVWRGHGEWHLKGTSGSLSIFEVADKQIASIRRPVASKENRRVIHGVLSRRSLMLIICAGLSILAYSLWMGDRKLYREQLENLERVRNFYSPAMEEALDGIALERVARADTELVRNAAFDYMRELDLFEDMDYDTPVQVTTSALDPTLKIESQADLDRLNTIYRRSVGALVEARPYEVHLGGAFDDEAPAPPLLDVPVLTRYMDAAQAATCTFVPNILRPPDSSRIRQLSSRRCTFLVRALAGLAISREHVGDASGADHALKSAARLAYHMGAEQYRYRDALTSMMLQQLVAPVAAAIYEQRGDLQRALDWHIYDLTLQLAYKELIRKRYYMSTLGQVLGSVSVQAAAYAAENDRRPFWRLEAAKELVYARSLWWNRRDSVYAAKMVERRIQLEQDLYVREWFKVLDQEIQSLATALPLIEEPHI